MSTMLIASAATSGFAIGFAPALVDSVRAALERQITPASTRIDRILSLFYVCWLPGMPIAGWLVDHGHAKEMLFFGLLASALGVAWIGMSKSAGALVASVLILGVGYCMVATAGIRMMPIALGFTTNVSTVAALNVGFVFVSVGAVAGPWLVQFAVGRWGCKQGLLYLSFALIVAAALVFLVHRELFPAGNIDAAWSQVFANVQIGLMAAVLLLYFAIENCLDIWPVAYLKDLRYEGRGLTIALLVFWGAFTLTRLATGWLPGTSWLPWILLGLLLVSAFTMGNLSGANEHNSGAIGFWLVGACLGPLLPSFLALVMDLNRELPATSIGIMLALNGLDTLLFRPVIAALSRRRPVRTVMRTPMLLALLLAAPLLVVALLALLPTL